ncbi:MAG TPA: hypothetical protein VNE62_06785 [Actinomycetota bacterium]|nr:hypothetical protein [Actinomycetota bacterium]
MNWLVTRLAPLSSLAVGLILLTSNKPVALWTLVIPMALIGLRIPGIRARRSSCALPKDDQVSQSMDPEEVPDRT